MNIVAVLVARMGSTRLPGKNLMEVAGAPMLQRMAERAAHSRKIDRIVLATTALPEDNALAALASRIGIGCFRGSEGDVLTRVLQAATEARSDLIVELLGDNPLVHSDLIDDTIDLFLNGDWDYAATVTSEYPSAGPEVKKFPIGVRVQVYAVSTLERSHALAEGPRYREDATLFIGERPDLFRIGFVHAVGRWEPLNAPTLHFAVNYQKNLDLIREVFAELYPRKPNFPLEDVMTLVCRRPALLGLMGR